MQACVQTLFCRYLFQVPGPASYPVPHPIPIVQPLPPPFPSVGGVLPISLNSVTQDKSEEKGGGELSSEDEDSVVYECYLCYREFESAKRLANHSTKQSHSDIMKKDFFSNQLWRFFPFPPDQGPEDFSICTRSRNTFHEIHAMSLFFFVRSTNCPGRLKCCSAHSLEEKEEWIMRYRHRNSSTTLNNHSDIPAEVIDQYSESTSGVSLSPNLVSSPVPAFSVSINKCIRVGKK